MTDHISEIANHRATYQQLNACNETTGFAARDNWFCEQLVHDDWELVLFQIFDRRGENGGQGVRILVGKLEGFAPASAVNTSIVAPE